MAVRMMWLLVTLLALVGAEPVQAQWSGDPCEALRLRLKVEGVRGGSLRVGETSGVTLKVDNVSEAPLTGLGIKLALSNGLCPIPQATKASPPLPKPKHPAIIEQAPTGGGGA